jgi:2-amino-4-hydroxy-6-hydroxymethyldihydropteridine diphosphokinase
MAALALVALGSNAGDSASLLRRAVERLRSFARAPLRCSSLWRTAPVDCPPGSPAFLNAAAAFEPLAEETPESLLAKLHALEAEFGRRRGGLRHAPRPLDLDLIAFGDAVRATPALTLPHPRAHLRRFVLAPLAEVAPEVVLPGQRWSVRELLERLAPGEAVERVGE